MPSYIIHLCVAKEYAKKYNIENEDEFIAGTVYPDSVKIKGQTHYSDYRSADTNLYKFLLDKKLDSSFNEGYFLHLLSDCLFYNKYFFGWRTMEREILMNDFDILNSKLIEAYNLTKIPEGLEKYFAIKKKGNTVEYHYDRIIEFIKEASSYELHNLAKEILIKKDYRFLLK